MRATDRDVIEVSSGFSLSSVSVRRVTHTKEALKGIESMALATVAHRDA
jgi:hypothetical protein